MMTTTMTSHTVHCCFFIQGAIQIGSRYSSWVDKVGNFAPSTCEKTWVMANLSFPFLMKVWHVQGVQPSNYFQIERECMEWSPLSLQNFEFRANFPQYFFSWHRSFDLISLQFSTANGLPIIESTIVQVTSNVAWLIAINYSFSVFTEEVGVRLLHRLRLVDASVPDRWVHVRVFASNKIWDWVE